MLTEAPPATGNVALSEGRLARPRALFWAEAFRAQSRGNGKGLAEAALGLGGLWVHENQVNSRRSAGAPYPTAGAGGHR